MKIKGFIQLIRPINFVMSSVAVFIGGLVGIGFDIFELSEAKYIILAGLAASSFTGAGNSLNDYLDRETDKINHPGRPIPSGNVSEKSAIIVTILGFLIALILGILVNFSCLVIVILNMSIMLFYEFKAKGKGFAGNLVIGWLVGSLFLFGGAAIGEMKICGILAFLAFLSTVGREVIKDIEDIKGDKDRESLPKVIGVKKASITASFMIFVPVVLSFLPFYPLEIFDKVYLVGVTIADAMFLYAILLLWKSDAEKSQKMCKFAMFVALVSFVVGAVI